MKLENQVTSLELSKKLKELAVEQTAYYSWVCHRGIKYTNEKDDWYILETEDTYNFKGKDIFSAFTVAELGEMLPREMGENGEKFSLTTYPDGEHWYCSYYCNSEETFTYINEKDEEFELEVYADIEANARAKMLIFLIENKLANP